MRRREFEVTKPEELRAVVCAIDGGTLALTTPQGTPLQVPLNFVQLGDQLYFHGSPAGEKVATLKQNDRASFLVVDPHAFLPSTFFDPENACPATQFFKSVLVKGRVRLVADPQEKARALQALMAKLQPEGGYDPISSENPRYQAALRGVAVIALAMESVTGKFKLGQNLSPELADRIMEQLEQRQAPEDCRTANAMEQYRPPAK
jgi:nitroimidazol reductase NimA-like FMN-containing flavoprotein (pyridoxamine 5'-phosphate oxidase superfamily)